MARGGNGCRRTFVELGVEGTLPKPQTEPWLWDNLGTLSYPITTSNVDAQPYFDQACAWRIRSIRTRRWVRSAN
jgi:hypothetical protein